MSKYIQMKNIFITTIQKDDHKTLLEVCFENLHEPKYSRLFKATLEKETEWKISAIAVYDSHKEKFLIVGSLYSPVLYEEIKNKILYALRQETMLDQQIAL